MLLETWLTLLPAAIVLILSFSTKKVIPSLITGILVGVIIMNWQTPLEGAFYLTEVIYNDFFNQEHLFIIVFTALIAISVKFMEMQGGFQSIVYSLKNKVNNKQKVEYFTWLSGIIIFFDDYANTLIVGNSVRTLSDKFKVSREKLAYIVDATSAPVASIGLITTWIGFQLGQIKIATEHIDIGLNSYQLFLGSLQYAYYPVLTLAFVGILIYSQRDFGPMLKAEQKAEEKDNAIDFPKYINQEGKPFYAILPISILLLSTLFFLIITGTSSGATGLTSILGASDPYFSILMGAFNTFFVCLIIEFSIGITKYTSIAAIKGIKQVAEPIFILLSAWAFADILIELRTADHLIHSFNLKLNPLFIPAIIFLIASLISFATGSSFGTMSIVYPIVIPFVWELLEHSPQIDQGVRLEIIYGTISVVLAGAVFGDHCSPISDTTILSSMSTNCDHIEHVKTQLPYAFTVGITSVTLLLIVFSFELPWWLSFSLGFLLITAIIYLLGKKHGNTEPYNN